MRFLVLAGLIGVVFWALARSLREQRLSWVRRLALPGTWIGEREGQRYRLVLEGDADQGSYCEITDSEDGRREERGRWKLVEQTLCFTPAAGAESACELRMFEAGRIGLHGPGRARRIYERESDNVVRLLQRSRS